jgi:hypothetical protein
VVEGDGLEVRSRMDGTRLLLHTTRRCDRVQMEQVERTEIREPDEDLTEEAVVLGLSTIPLTLGIVMLVDAPNVYQDDQNARQYNPVGPDGAYVGGVVLTSIGGLLALVPMIELARIASGGDERESIETRRGATMETGVPCEAPARPVNARVVLRVGGYDVTTVGTDHDGLMDIDLAAAIPPEIARKAVVVQVIVDDQLIGELDIGPVVDAHARRPAPKPDAIIAEEPPEEPPEDEDAPDEPDAPIPPPPPKRGGE